LENNALILIDTITFSMSLIFFLCLFPYFLGQIFIVSLANTFDHLLLCHT
jgi:hypothetical protein